MISARLTEKLRSLPTLPAVAVELLQLCQDPEVDLSRIAARLEQDPALAARLLRVANSAFYSGGAEVKTVKRAVSMLGSNSVVTLALSFSLVSAVRGLKGFDHAAFWRRALLSGLAGRCLARRTEQDADELFLAALFQDLGMLALNAAFPDYGQLVSETTGDHARLERREEELLNVTHPEVGGWLADHWRLPGYLGTAALASHDPRRVPKQASGRTQALCNCVALSGLVADVWCGQNPVQASRDAGAQAAELLGLDGNDFWELLSDVGEEFSRVSALFEVHLDEARVRDVLDQAKETLVEVSLRAAQRADQSEQSLAALAQERRQVEGRAARDPLTQLFGRDVAEAALKVALATAAEYHRPAGLLAIGLDQHAAVRQERGALEADTLLALVSRALEGCLRRTGDVFTSGMGGSFLVVLPGTNPAGAAVVAERMRTVVAQLVRPGSAPGPLGLTLSVGVVCQEVDQPVEPAPQLFGRAEERLAAAQAAGGDRIVTQLHA
jgi:diguanylate cyclase (GGDEF)-like protein